MKKFAFTLFSLLFMMQISLLSEDEVERLKVPQEEHASQSTNSEEEEHQKEPEHEELTEEQKETPDTHESIEEHQETDIPEDASKTPALTEAEIEAREAEEAELREAGIGEEPIPE